MADPDGAGGGVSSEWEYRLRKYLLLLATLVATVTYSAAFNPPGGVWQDADPGRGRVAGDPIIRETSYRRYLAFFYSNATAFASSLVVIVLVLILSVLHEAHEQAAGTDRPRSLAPLRILRVVMVLDLLSLMGPTPRARSGTGSRLSTPPSCWLASSSTSWSTRRWPRARRRRRRTRRRSRWTRPRWRSSAARC